MTDFSLARTGQDVEISGYLEVLLHPFGKGTLPAAGTAQYSALHTTTTDAYETVEEVTIKQILGYTLEEIEFSLTAAFQSSSTTEDVLYKWQASDNGVSYQDLCAEQTYSADASALSDKSVEGRFAPTGNFLGTGSSFKIKCVVKSGSAGGETAKGKTKASSWVKLVYRRS